MRPLQSRIAWVLGTWFGCGLVPKAPGTAGSIGALPVYVVLVRMGRPAVGVAALALIIAGVWASSVMARELGRKDPEIVVIDEVAGMLVTLLPLRHPTWAAVLIGFALFRLFDVVKPGPVASLEKLPRGWGIVLDDVGAGALAALVLVLLRAVIAMPSIVD